jgi:polyisoprenoid-binding protein YceI
MVKAILSVVALFALFSANIFASDFKVDTKASQLKWTGEKVTGSHWGYVNIKSGVLKVEDNKIINGDFTIDMTSMNVKDLEPGEYNTKLLGHLKSDDFFSVDKNPESAFKIKWVKDNGNGTIKVVGDLTIKGITKQLSFDAKYTASGNKITAEAKIPVDRTKYDIKYGSGSFFDSLGDKTIYDEFTLDLKLVATKS